MDFRLINIFKKLLRSHLIGLAARLILGGIFIYASYHKILAPDKFAEIVYGHDLFPNETINLIAIVIPFIELTSGIALIIGFYTRPAATIIVGMLVAFRILGLDQIVSVLIGHSG